MGRVPEAPERSVTEASRQAGLFARLGSAHENACGIVPRPSLQPLHQALQQPGARLDRREEHVFMIRVGAGAVDAESIERWDPHRDREMPSDPPPTSGALSSWKPI